MTDLGGPLSAAGARVASLVDRELVLLDHAAQGDVEAFDALLRPRLDRLCRMAVAITRSEADARDAVQEASIQAWRQLPKLRDRTSFDPWLGQIVVNACRGLLRSQNRRRVREITVEDTTDGIGEIQAPSGAAPDGIAEAEAVQRAFLRLDPDARVLIALHHVEQRPLDEIAGVLRVPVGTVKWRLFQARLVLELGVEGGRPMSQRERNDAIFRAALTPPASLSLTAGLADAIHDSLVATPQETPARRWHIGGRPILALARATLLVLMLLALLVLGAVAAILSSRPVPSPLGVQMFRGGPERTGVMPGPGPAGDPIVDWQFSMNGPVAVMPVVLDGTVYAADGHGTVQALDEATGKAGWTTELGSSVNGSPAIAGGRLFLGTDAGDVVALDLLTGSEAWRFKAEGPVRASPAIVGDVLYVGSDDGNVYSLDLATGDRLWAQALGAPVTRGVAISADIVYAGATGGRFTALDAKTGMVRWSRDDLGMGEVGTPMVADGLVFVATGLLEVGPSDRVVALDVKDGRERWHFATRDREPVYAGAVAEGAVFVSCNNGDIYRLEEMTGDVVQGWPLHANGPVGYMTGLVDGVIYASSGDHLVHAIDVATGRYRWQFELQGEPNVPAVVGGRVFVGTNLGKIVAIGGTKAAESP